MRLGCGAGRLFEMPLHKNGTSDAMSRETVTSGNDSDSMTRCAAGLCRRILHFKGLHVDLVKHTLTPCNSTFFAPAIALGYIPPPKPVDSET